MAEEGARPTEEAGGEAPALAIVGATATGKTALSILVARALGGEIISMDSRQVYRGLDLGTAKATPAERAAVPHHGLDLVDPGERYSAGRFARDARGWIAAIRARGRVPLLVGGTGFFLRALTHPLFREPELPGEPRAVLNRFLQQLPAAERLRWLSALDPPTARRLQRGGGTQRVSRALEVALLTGRPLSWWHARAPAESRPLIPAVFVLELPAAELDRRVESRVDRMMEAGLLEEVRRLSDEGWGPGDPGLSATGYAELLPVLTGETSMEDAVDRIKANTRRYARRQRTWLRHQLPAGRVRLDARRPLHELAEEVVRRWERR